MKIRGNWISFKMSVPGSAELDHSTHTHQHKKNRKGNIEI